MARKGPTLRAAPVGIKVPATSANLGPGFDSLGLALSLYDVVAVQVTDEGLLVDVTGSGAATVNRGPQNLVVRSMRATFKRLGGQPDGLALSCANQIPHGRGLGSSAAAIVAGVLAARELVVGGRERLDDEATLALAAELEGHPDNVAPCLRGGLTIAWTNDDGVARAVSSPVSKAIAPVVFVPAAKSSTKAVRKLLPEVIPHRDGVRNASRSALLIAALATHPDVLFDATEDRLHQPYRAAAMPQSAALVAELRGAGIPAVISGAGPSVLALTTKQTRAALIDQSRPGWDVLPLDIDRDGAHVVSVPRRNDADERNTME